ncbi:MAG TPA: cytochrome C oxidase subunit IV family protein, partial [Anaerolineae bacterium]|nr:cytochrome C oxidase subunit IV family protein [Anaerolineae bacterium]
EPVDEKTLAGRKAAYRQGLYVLIGLAVLTAVEFAVAFLLEGSVVFLFVLALAKAGVILQYYMHLGSVWSEEEAH